MHLRNPPLLHSDDHHNAIIVFDNCGQMAWGTGHREAPTNGSDCVHVFGGYGRAGYCQQEEPISTVRVVAKEVPIQLLTD